MILMGQNQAIFISMLSYSIGPLLKHSPPPPFPTWKAFEFIIITDSSYHLCDCFWIIYNNQYVWMKNVFNL